MVVRSVLRGIVADRLEGGKRLRTVADGIGVRRSLCDHHLVSGTDEVDGSPFVPR